MADPTTPTEDNSTIKEMRTRIDELTTQVKDSETTKSALAQAQAELDALKPQLQELQTKLAEASTPPDVERLKAYESKLEELYEDEIASAPEDKREALRKITSTGDMLHRIEQVKGAKSLIGANVASGNPPTNPQGVIGVPTPTPTPPPAPVPGVPFKPPAWDQVLKPAGSSS